MADGGQRADRQHLLTGRADGHSRQRPLPAAKSGVNALTKTFAQELGPRIRVNGIMPSMVPTEIAITAMGLTDADLPRLEWPMAGITGSECERKLVDRARLPGVTPW